MVRFAGALTRPVTLPDNAPPWDMPMQEYNPDGTLRERPGEGAVQPARLRYSYYTAGSGGVGPTILETSMLLAGEEVVAYRDGQKASLGFRVSNFDVHAAGRRGGRGLPRRPEGESGLEGVSFRCNTSAPRALAGRVSWCPFSGRQFCVLRLNSRRMHQRQHAAAVCAAP